jgi:hypothetical protein
MMLDGVRGGDTQEALFNSDRTGLRRMDEALLFSYGKQYPKDRGEAEISQYISQLASLRQVA